MYPYILDEQFATRAFGASTFHRLYCPGRIEIDLLFYFRRSTLKLERYSLDRVAEAVLGEHKAEDKTFYQKMWHAWNNRDAKFLGRVAKYCVVDADLVLRIAAGFQVWINLLGQSVVTFLPIGMLASRGEQIKTFSQLLRLGNAKGYVFVDSTFQLANGLLEKGTGKAAKTGDDEEDPDGPLINDEESYAGGFVLDPKVNAYFDWPVHVFDFQVSEIGRRSTSKADEPQSLYPSIIRSHKLCFTSWVFDNEKYGNLEGYEYEDVVVDRMTYRFCRHDKTILPLLQDALFAKRKEVKALLKTETDPFMREVLDARQVSNVSGAPLAVRTNRPTKLGLKIAMNASYGFLVRSLVCAEKGGS